MTSRSSTMRTTALAFMAGVAIVRVCAADDGQFLMVDRSLRAVLVNVTSIGPAGARVIDEKGEPIVVPFGEIVALAPGWWRPGTEGSEIAWAHALPGSRRLSADSGGMLMLTDGRRIVGRLVSDADGERVAWEHPRLGSAAFALDDIRRIAILPTGVPMRSAQTRNAGDRVITTNADEVNGFVDAIGSIVKVEAEGKKVELSLRQVAAIELANPSRKPAGVRLWLQDGSVVGAKGFAAPTTDGDLQIQMESPAASDTALPATLSLMELVALTPDASRLMPLAGLPIEFQKGVGDRMYAEPVALRWRGESMGAAWQESATPGDPAPPLDAPDIELPGPMVVEWTLPAGAVRVAGWAEVPTESRLWAEFTLVIEGVGAGAGAKSVALASESMSGTRPIAEFNIELPRPAPERLRISMDPGARGPIQDRVVLRRALVLIDPAAR